MDLLFATVSFATTGLYFLVQAITPNAILSCIANHLPYKEDYYAPSGFFAPKPALPPSTSVHPAPGYPLSWVKDALGYIILKRDAALVGTVAAVEPLYDPKTENWGHQTFYVRPDNKGLLNAFSPNVELSWHGGANTIKCIAPVPLTDLPKQGDRVVVYCTMTIPFFDGYPLAVARAWGAVM